MIFLFIHQNFPGQYQHIVRHLASQPDNTVYFISQANDNFMAGVQKLVYRPDFPRQMTCHPFTGEIDVAVRVGLAVRQVCRELKQNGVRPDCIVGHNGWGETLFVKDVFPDVPLLAYFEFFYHARGVDVGFDPEYPSLPDDSSRLRVRNTVNHIGFDAADWGHTATHWQRSLYPPEMRARITALHEGVDVDIARPDPNAWIKLARNERTLSRDDEVITYVARNLEPYRGFHVFMRALSELLRRRPKAHVLIIGGDEVSYGRAAPPGTTYRQMLLQEVARDIDLDRVHFLGQIPHASYINVLQISSAHIYLTYPFVLSWSFIEAMAAGCLVIGSKTEPVLEVLRDRENGLAVNFFSTREICDRVEEALEQPERMAPLRAAARETALANYDLRRQLPRWLSLISDLVEGKRPPELREAAE